MRLSAFAVGLAFAVALAPVNAHAVGVKQAPSDDAALTAADLVSMESGMDGQTVRIEGEVISEALAGGNGHVWVNVLSEGVAVGVWMSREDAEAIDDFGTYRHSGDVIEVTGVFHEACDQHGGDLDIHVEKLNVIRQGEPIERPVSYWKIGLGVAGLVGARIILRRRREGQPV